MTNDELMQSLQEMALREIDEESTREELNAMTNRQLIKHVEWLELTARQALTDEEENE